MKLISRQETQKKVPNDDSRTDCTVQLSSTNTQQASSSTQLPSSSTLPTSSTTPTQPDLDLLDPRRDFYKQSRSFPVLVLAGLIAIGTTSGYSLANLTLWNNGIQDLNRSVLSPGLVFGSFTLCVLWSLVLDSDKDMRDEVYGSLYRLVLLLVFLALIHSAAHFEFYNGMQMVAGGTYVFLSLVRFHPKPVDARSFDEWIQDRIPSWGWRD